MRLASLDLQPILYTIGVLLSILAIAMILPMMADLYLGHQDWKVFFLCITLTAFFGGALILTNTMQEFKMNLRQLFLLTFASWVSISLFAALPFKFSHMDMSFTKAFFEATSGVTTTGATVMQDLDHSPPGILLWRAILQWLGGIGIIVMAIGVLPFLKVGGMQLFRNESTEREKALPRAKQLATAIGTIYLALTFICAIAYMFVGFVPFDAICHAMTTLATGGYSNFSSSFEHLDNAGPEIVAIIFMTLGGMPFILYMRALRGDTGALLKDSQVRAYLSIIAFSTVLLVSYLLIYMDFSLWKALKVSLFSVISFMTGTGYTNADVSAWGGFPIALLLFLMVVGGCAGSTTCGIKVFRFQVLYSVAKTQIKKLIHPSGVFVPNYGGSPIPRDAIISVMSFFLLFSSLFILGVVAMSATGVDLLTALSSTATSLANVGPGLGATVGTPGHFAAMPDSALWIMSLSMLLGRLELFTALILLTPHFWKN